MKQKFLILALFVSAQCNAQQIKPLPYIMSFYGGLFNSLGSYPYISHPAESNDFIEFNSVNSSYHSVALLSNCTSLIVSYGYIPHEHKGRWIIEQLLISFISNRIGYECGQVIKN